MLNYACEAGEAGKAGDGNTAAFTAGGAAKMTRAVNHRSGQSTMILGIFFARVCKPPC